MHDWLTFAAMEQTYRAHREAAQVPCVVGAVCGRRPLRGVQEVPATTAVMPLAPDSAIMYLAMPPLFWLLMLILLALPA